VRGERKKRGEKRVERRKGMEFDPDPQGKPRIIVFNPFSF